MTKQLSRRQRKVKNEPVSRKSKEAVENHDRLPLDVYTHVYYLLGWVSYNGMCEDRTRYTSNNLRDKRADQKHWGGKILKKKERGRKKKIKRKKNNGEERKRKKVRGQERRKKVKKTRKKQRKRKKETKAKRRQILNKEE